MTDTLQTIHLEDYQPPPYLVDHVDLHFELEPTRTIVRTTLKMRVNPAVHGDAGPL